MTSPLHKFNVNQSSIITGTNNLVAGRYGNTEECAQACLADPQCNSFTWWDPYVPMCSLSTNVKEDYPLKEAKYKWFYQKKQPTPIASNGISTNGKCGPLGNNKVCPNGQCCSEFGECGSTLYHCGPDCQKAFGACRPWEDNPGNLKPVPSVLLAGRESDNKSEHMTALSELTTLTSMIPAFTLKNILIFLVIVFVAMMLVTKYKTGTASPSSTLKALFAMPRPKPTITTQLASESMPFA